MPRCDPAPGPLHRLPGRVCPRNQPVLPGWVPADSQAHLCCLWKLRERKSDGEGLVNRRPRRPQRVVAPCRHAAHPWEGRTCEFCSVLFFVFSRSFPARSLSSFAFSRCKKKQTNKRNRLQIKERKFNRMEGAYKRRVFFSSFSGKGSRCLCLPLSLSSLFFSPSFFSVLFFPPSSLLVYNVWKLNCCDDIASVMLLRANVE